MRRERLPSALALLFPARTDFGPQRGKAARGEGAAGMVARGGGGVVAATGREGGARPQRIDRVAGRGPLAGEAAESGSESEILLRPLCLRCAAESVHLSGGQNSGFPKQPHAGGSNAEALRGARQRLPKFSDADAVLSGEASPRPTGFSHGRAPASGGVSRQDAARRVSADLPAAVAGGGVFSRLPERETRTAQVPTAGVEERADWTRLGLLDLQRCRLDTASLESESATGGLGEVCRHASSGAVGP